MDKYTTKTTRVTPTFNAELDKKITTESIQLTTSSTFMPTNTSSLTAISTNSSNVVSNVSKMPDISPTSTTESTTTHTTSTYEIHVNATPTITGNVTHIESSLQDILQTIKEEMSLDVSTLSTTPTEKLPTSSLPETSKSKMTTTISNSATIGEYIAIQY